MASELITSKPRGFLATPSYLRLWFAGGIGNAMRWLELLVAGIFTYEVTQSTVLVALVTVARSLPMLFIGTIAGVIDNAQGGGESKRPASNVDAALDLAGRGFYVFPIADGTKDKPLVRWSKEAATDEA